MKTKIQSMTLTSTYAKVDVPKGLKLLEIINSSGNAMTVKIDNVGTALSVASGSTYQKKSDEGIENDIYLAGSGDVTIELEY